MGQDDEDDAQMLQVKQQLTNNVINKRKDQLRRWQSSEMNAEPTKRMKRPKVQFQDSDIFLSACMSGDEEEVDELLAKGADINTCTVDGLTALHQSVIDSKPEMVRYLCEKGADVNAQDNEGWTPLHAAACCGNVAIVRYLCQHGADLSIVNSDKELPLDLADDEQCREYLEDDYKRKSIDVDGCREKELNTMLRDAKIWLSTGEYKDIPHQRTGGTAMHVAAARGYTQLLELLIKAGGNVRAQDKDGWTPLHAAAHWAERDACKILVENGAELSDNTTTGQDVISIADKDVVDYLVDLAETAKNREKRKSPSAVGSVLQEKNHRTPIHEEHIMSSERKREFQHKDQHSENEFIHNTNGTSPTMTTTTTVLTIPQPSRVVKEEDEEKEDEEEAAVSLTTKLQVGGSREEDEEEEVEDELEEELEEEEDEEEEDEEEEEEEEEVPSEIEKEEEKKPYTLSRSASREMSNRSSSERMTSSSSVDRSSAGGVGSESESRSTSATTTTSSSSRFGTSSGSTATGSTGSSTAATISSHRSVSVPPINSPVGAAAPITNNVTAIGVGSGETTPRSSLESSSMGSGDQHVSATVPIVPTTAPPPPKAVHQSPSSWINRGFPLSSRNSSSSVTTRSSSTPISEITSPPPSHNYQQVTPSPSTTQTSNVMAATISSMAKNSPTPSTNSGSTGNVTISATFSKPSRWQSKTVNESEAERRNNSRMQRQHRRSTQGVTKEQLEEASRFAVDETSRRNSAALLNQHVQPISSPGSASSPALIRLASEEGDLSISSSSNGMSGGCEEFDESTLKNGDVTMAATVSLNNTTTSSTGSSAAANNVRRKSQALTISRSNRRATGPVNPEDLVQLRPTSIGSSSEQNGSIVGSGGLRLATTGAGTGIGGSQPYSPASVRSVAGTVPTMTSRFAEKAHSLPPGSNGGGGSSTTSTGPTISSRSAIVAGLSPAPRTASSGSGIPPSQSMGTRYGGAGGASSSSSSYLSNVSTTVAPTSSYSLHRDRPTETNLNYKALYEKERSECDRLRKEIDDIRRSSSSTIENWRGVSTVTPSWRSAAQRNQSPSTPSNGANLSVAKSTSLASFDESERKSMERKIAELESQLKTSANLRLENQRLKEENGALARVISKMTI